MEALSPPPSSSFAVRSWSGRVCYSRKRGEEAAREGGESESPQVYEWPEEEEGVVSCYDYYAGHTEMGEEVVHDGGVVEWAIEEEPSSSCDEVSEEEGLRVLPRRRRRRRRPRGTPAAAVRPSAEESDTVDSDGAADAQWRHRVLLDRMAAERAAEAEEQAEREEREARRRAERTRRLAERSAARQAARQSNGVVSGDDPGGSGGGPRVSAEAMAERAAAAEAARQAARAAKIRAARRRQKESYRRLLDELARKRQTPADDEEEGGEEKKNASSRRRSSSSAASSSSSAASVPHRGGGGVSRHGGGASSDDESRRDTATKTKQPPVPGGVFPQQPKRKEDFEPVDVARGSGGAAAARLRQHVAAAPCAAAAGAAVAVDEAPETLGDTAEARWGRECSRRVREMQRQHIERLIAERRQREMAQADESRRLARQHKARADRVQASLEAKQRSVRVVPERGGDDDDQDKPECNTSEEDEDDVVQDGTATKMGRPRLVARQGGNHGASSSSSKKMAQDHRSKQQQQEQSQTQKQQQVSASAQRALIERLNNSHRSSVAGGFGPTAARDYADWKRKRGIRPEQRVFVMTGWYPCVKDELVSRGWVHNPDRDSPYFDLKWTLTSRHLLEPSSLEPWQYANHFQKTRGLVTKVGLSQTLGSLPWYARETGDAIFPRCYDLSNAAEAKAFVGDYRGLEAARVLTAIVRLATIEGDDDEREPPIVNAQVYAAAMATCERRRRLLCAEDLDDDNDDGGQDSLPASSSCSDGEAAASAHLELLAMVSDSLARADDDAAVAARVLSSPVELADVRRRRDNEGPSSNAAEGPPPPPPPHRRFDRVDAAIEARLRAADELSAAPVLSSSSSSRPTVADEAARRAMLRRKHNAQKREARARERVAERAALPGSRLQAEDVERAARLLEALACASQQAGLDGYSLARQCSPARPLPRNLWIVKPAAKSRGRGIATFRSLEALFEYCDMIPPRPPGGDDPDRPPKQNPSASSVPTATTWKPGGGMWVVQKYVENQLLIAKRKFDLRQWVLVTKWNPLTIWFYDECYARFSAADFTSSGDELQNEFVHLVNNSITKHSTAFHDRVVAENGVEVKDCMWTLAQFRDYLRWKDERDPFSARRPASSGRHLLDTPRRAGDDNESQARRGEKHHPVSWAAATPAAATTTAQGARPDEAEDSDDVFATLVQPAMKRIVTCALMCAQDSVEPRTNSWELYGFDFMLDDAGKPWLIEINSSPACDYSTAVTEAYVRRALVDILKVTLDHAAWTPGSGSPEPDTGGWKRLYVGPVLETPVAAFGGAADIVCRGASVPEPRDFRRARLAARARDQQLRRHQQHPGLVGTAPQPHTRGGEQGSAAADDDDDDDYDGDQEEAEWAEARPTTTHALPAHAPVAAVAEAAAPACGASTRLAELEEGPAEPTASSVVLVEEQAAPPPPPKPPLNPPPHAIYSRRSVPSSTTRKSAGPNKLAVAPVKIKTVTMEI